MQGSWDLRGILDHLRSQLEGAEVLLLNWVQGVGYICQQVVPSDQTGLGKCTNVVEAVGGLAIG